MKPHTTHYDASEHHHDDCGCQSERLRKELAAAQAHIVALRGALQPMFGRSLVADALRSFSSYQQQQEGRWSDHQQWAVGRAIAIDTALSQPTGTEALRAFGERCAEAGQKDAFDEMSAMDAGVPRKQQDSAAIVARILSGGAE